VVRAASRSVANHLGQLIILFRMEASPLPTQINLRLVDPDVPTVKPEAAPAPARGRRERPVLVFRGGVRPLRYRWYPACKTCFDFTLALLLSILALPVIVVVALVVKLTSSGPAFYSQLRVGRHGRLFTIWKIRTMIHNCESLTGPRWSMPGDPRVTPVGWLLRKTHLDELPQLWNVLRGDMSLIGPRPERPEFVPELERAIPGYVQRLQIKPGVTGLAQVQLPPDTDLGSVRRKLAADLNYIERLSPWMDVKILACTGLYAAGMSTKWLARLLGLPDPATVQERMMEPAPTGRPRVAA
jgi:lipopolysaccharide/colanic/teichoic acid biosynthesis glycosyltransferase